MLIPFGTLAASGAAPAGAYELISTTVLGSTESSVTFSSLGDYASTYKHLQIRAVTRSSGSVSESVYFRFNGDTGSNYSWHGLNGSGSGASSFGYPDFSLMGLSLQPGSNSPSNSFAFCTIDILDAYSTTKNKTARSLAGFTGANNFIRLYSSSWRNTSALTSITILPEASSFATGSRFSIYGIKG
jgi:hypothetical protein